MEDFPLQSRKLGVSNATGVSPRARPSAARVCLAYSLRRGNIPTPVPTPRHAPHLRTTPCGAFPVELFTAGFSPDAGRVTDRYDKLSCRSSLGSRRLGDHVGLPPADGIRASSPGTHLRMRPLTRFGRNWPLVSRGVSPPSQTLFPEKKHCKLGTQQPRGDIELTNGSPTHVAQRFCIALISKRIARDGTPPRAPLDRNYGLLSPHTRPKQRNQCILKASHLQHEPLSFEEDYSQ